MDFVSAQDPLDEPVTILAPTNAALDRNTTRELARAGLLQDVRTISAHLCKFCKSFLVKNMPALQQHLHVMMCTNSAIMCTYL